MYFSKFNVNFVFLFSHLADAFIQSNLQMRTLKKQSIFFYYLLRISTIQYLRLFKYLNQIFNVNSFFKLNMYMYNSIFMFKYLDILHLFI